MNSGPSERQYVVLADVINSREIESRDTFKNELHGALTEINDAHRGSIDTDFEVIKGIDEFGGVLQELSPLYDIISYILNRIHPVKVRFSIASGFVDIKADSIAEMDGPAFHVADGILSAAERDNMYAYIDTGSNSDQLVSNNLNLLLMHRENLTEHQVEVIRTYEQAGTQSAAAEELGVPQQSISKALGRADYNRLSRVKDSLRVSLEELYDS